MSKRLRAAVLREQRQPGVTWLPKPVTLTPQSTLYVIGVANDAPKPLYRWWLRESHQRGIRAQPQRWPVALVRGSIRWLIRGWVGQFDCR
jgi:hypothetical protein